MCSLKLLRSISQAYELLSRLESFLTVMQSHVFYIFHCHELYKKGVFIIKETVIHKVSVFTPSSLPCFVDH